MPADAIMVKLPLVNIAQAKRERRNIPADHVKGHQNACADAIIVKEPLVMSAQPKWRERRYAPAEVKGSIRTRPTTPSW